jgi:hypothetical protein
MSFSAENPHFPGVFMKSLILSLLSLVVSFSAFASDEPLLVCERVPVSGIEKIVIEKDGAELRLIEIQDAHGVSKGAATVSQPFSLEAFQAGELPALSEHNGYRRKLVRSGRNSYVLESSDECTTSFITLSCKESFAAE